MTPLYPVHVTIALVSSATMVPLPVAVTASEAASTVVPSTYASTPERTSLWSTKPAKLSASPVRDLSIALPTAPSSA